MPSSLLDDGTKVFILCFRSYLKSPAPSCLYSNVLLIVSTTSIHNEPFFYSALTRNHVDDDWAGYPEALFFDRNDVIFRGLHLTAGVDTDSGRRPASEASLEWIDVNYKYYAGTTSSRIMVVFANAAVTDPTYADFFVTLLQRCQDDYFDMRFIWVQPSRSSRRCAADSTTTTAVPPQ